MSTGYVAALVMVARAMVTVIPRFGVRTFSVAVQNTETATKFTIYKVEP